eukprot:scaffold112026_cov18-Tisochrysis_lutea.AAC.1
MEKTWKRRLMHAHTYTNTRACARAHARMHAHKPHLDTASHLQRLQKVHNLDAIHAGIHILFSVPTCRMSVCILYPLRLQLVQEIGE